MDNYKSHFTNKYVITCQLPDNDNTLDESGNLVYEENFFCGFAPVPSGNFAGLQAIEWDSNIRYAHLFASRYDAKQMIKRIATGEPLSIRLLTEEDIKNVK